MNLPAAALARPTVVLVIAALFVVAGVLNFAQMSRREDPQVTVRDALVITSWPGASATRVEELVTDPIEAVVGTIAEVDELTSKSRVGLSVIQVRLEDRIRAPDQFWDEVRAKVRTIEPRLPPGSSTPVVNADFGEVYAICFALHHAAGAGDVPLSPRELEVLAEKAEDELQLIDAVARVDVWGIQEERIYVEVDSADWARIGITARELRDLFAARNIVASGGEIDTERGSFAVEPTGEFTTVAQIEDLVVSRRAGAPVRLGDLPIRVERRYVEPPRTLTRFTTPTVTGAPCLILGVSMKSGRNINDLDADVETTLRHLRDHVLPADVALERVNDLPRQVDERIRGLVFNLLQGVAIVLVIALLITGWRAATVMATAVPLAMIAALAVIRPFGTELEQFSVASLVIALGMVVDNAIVVSDNTVRKLREGASRNLAAASGAHDLAVPILTSTLTTVCAFLPMLAIVGDVGEYVSSLPMVVAATLGCSYLVAMLVTPLMCRWLLRPPGAEPKAVRPTEAPEERTHAYDRALLWCLSHRGIVLGAAGTGLLLSVGLTTVIGSQFFPSGLRDQVFIKVWLPEGSPIAETARVCGEVEAILVEESPTSEGVERLANAVTFVGTGGPRMILTQEPEYDYPYLGYIVVNTTEAEHSIEYARTIRIQVANIPGARITVENFMLGPPIRDQVAFRLSGPDRELLRTTAEDMVRASRDTSGVRSAYSNWGSAGYRVEVEIDADAANLAGVTNADVAFTLSSLLSGADLSTFREGDHLVPIVFRTLPAQRANVEDLSGIFVPGSAGKVPLASVARLVPEWEPAMIARRNRIPTVTVGGRVVEGELANEVAARTAPEVRAIAAALPEGYRLEVDGEQEETTKAQVQVIYACLLAFALIVLVLVVQYDSLVKPLVVLSAVPMAFIGVAVGLYVTGWAMGFMAMLGLLSLGGIVINNAIILIDFIETRVAAGMELRPAVAAAGRLRMRPIVLTSLTTIGGLLPLSLFGGPLWAPMTNGMIFGLLFSTVLTLFVVPTIYVLLAEQFGMRVLKRRVTSESDPSG